MEKRPKIGITMRLEIETRRFYLGRDYCEAIQAVGGVPVHLGLIPKREYIAAALDGIDGILLPGSDTDVDPARYGEEPHPKLKRVVPEKDETDRLVLEEAEKRGLPVFAICYGMQALNVWRGGTLVQDIEAQVDSPLKHEQGAPLARPSHRIRIESESVLSNLASVSEELEARVNSHHHQAIKKVGANLKAVAWAKDGVIECIQDTRSGVFALGVQWHPELAWADDVFSRELFDYFVKACSAMRAGEPLEIDNLFVANN
jgi:putative glutamine amidotransferase